MEKEISINSVGNLIKDTENTDRLSETLIGSKYSNSSSCGQYKRTGEE